MPLRGMAYSAAGLGKIAKRLFDLRIGGGGGFSEGDFDFQNGGPSGSMFDFNEYYTNTQTAPSSGTLFITALELGVGGGAGGCMYYGYIIDGQGTGMGSNNTYTVSISSGSELKFYWSSCGEPYANTVSITLQNEDSSGVVIDTFTMARGGCFLTTAVVNYMGLLDNGPELMAMRELRNHYSTVQGYDSLISEYYENAPKIIEAIGDDSEVYEEIYRSVKMCQAFVENENWQAAHDEYFRMYNDLKARYLK